MIDNHVANRLMAAEHARFMNGIAPKSAVEKAQRYALAVAGDLADRGMVDPSREAKFTKLNATISLRGDKEPEYGRLVAIATFGADPANLATVIALIWVREAAAAKTPPVRRCIECGSPFFSRGSRAKCNEGHAPCFNEGEKWAGEETWGRHFLELDPPA